MTRLKHLIGPLAIALACAGLGLAQTGEGTARSIVCLGVCALSLALAYKSVQTQTGFGIACGLGAGLLTLLFVLQTMQSRYFYRTCEYTTYPRAQIAAFDSALDNYQIDTGAYPSGTNGLEALLKAPPGATNWHGPYLSADAIPLDPWRRPYVYQNPGTHNSNGYDLFSLGKPGENSPIGNWPAH